ncbi:MAG: exodeoxyribonuclease VII small subunit [Gammaproteobacteria bacterium]
MGKIDSFDFEKALGDLNAIITELEKGDGHLETSLKQFEEGIKLTRQCQQALKEAEQKVSILLDNSDDAELTDFYENVDEDEDDTFGE